MGQAHSHAFTLTFTLTFTFKKAAEGIGLLHTPSP